MNENWVNCKNSKHKKISRSRACTRFLAGLFGFFQKSGDSFLGEVRLFCSPLTPLPRQTLLPEDEAASTAAAPQTFVRKLKRKRKWSVGDGGGI